jgi:hypothetical protein
MVDEERCIRMGSHGKEDNTDDGSHPDRPIPPPPEPNKHEKK